MTGPDAPGPLPPYVPISCGDYEHVEAACMDACHVEVVMDGETVRGLAADTTVNGQGEFLVLELDDGSYRLIRVDRIRKLVVLSDPRRFDDWVFSG